MNIRTRLAFAKAHVYCSDEQWVGVLFTNESKFELLGSYRRVFVRGMHEERFKKECVTSTDKHGRVSIIVLGGICRPTKLKLIQGLKG